MASVSNTTLYVVYVAPSNDAGVPPTGQIRIVRTIDLSTWIGETAYDTENDPGFLVDGSQLIDNPIFAPGFGIMIRAVDQDEVNLSAFFLVSTTVFAFGNAFE
jgi:hypothetical protein